MRDLSFLKEPLNQALSIYSLPGCLSDPLLEYLGLLDHWNRAYNLSAIRDPKEMLVKHLLDSLAVLSFIRGSRILDVGTGAGLPGIVIALARPDASLFLLDANGKKMRFLREVIRVLSLSRVTLLESRIEHYAPEQAFDTVISRAFSSLVHFIDETQSLLAPGGLLLAMKGRYPQEELLAVKQPYRVKTYEVVGLDAERCCVFIEKE